MHCHSEIIGISNEATVKDFRKAAVNFMKGYFVTDGYMGLVDGVYRLFADESDYYEYMDDRATWPEQFDYIMDTCIKMKRAFKRYL